MNFVADESVDFPIVEQLRQAGHIVLAIAETSPGVDDEAVLESAQTQQAILITGDRDFGELAFRLRRVHFGIILIRLGGIAAGSKAQIVAAAITQHAGELLGSFSVISPGQIRIRHTPQ